MYINCGQSPVIQRRSRSTSATSILVTSICIDLMVQEGFYSNRTDFIRTAIRNQLERHADVVKQSTVRKKLDLGLRHYNREDLEAARVVGEMLHIHVLGLASIAPDVIAD